MGLSNSKIPKEVRKAIKHRYRDFKWEKKPYKLEYFPEPFWKLDLLSLTISACGLNTTPQGILGFANVVEINLSHNALTTLPDLSSLRLLQKLDVSNNHLVEFPDFVSGMKTLILINVSWNDIKNTPSQDAIKMLINVPNLLLFKNSWTEPALQQIGFDTTPEQQVEILKSLIIPSKPATPLVSSHEIGTSPTDPTQNDGSQNDLSGSPTGGRAGPNIVNARIIPGATMMANAFRELKINRSNPSLNSPEASPGSPPHDNAEVSEREREREELARRAASGSNSSSYVKGNLVPVMTFATAEELGTIRLRKVKSGSQEKLPSNSGTPASDSILSGVRLKKTGDRSKLAREIWGEKSMESTNQPVQTTEQTQAVSATPEHAPSPVKEEVAATPTQETQTPSTEQPKSPAKVPESEPQTPQIVEVPAENTKQEDITPIGETPLQLAETLNAEAPINNVSLTEEAVADLYYQDEKTGPLANEVFVSALDMSPSDKEEAASAQ